MQKKDAVLVLCCTCTVLYLYCAVLVLCCTVIFKTGHHLHFQCKYPSVLRRSSTYIVGPYLSGQTSRLKTTRAHAYLDMLQGLYNYLVKHRRASVGCIEYDVSVGY